MRSEMFSVTPTARCPRATSVESSRCPRPTGSPGRTVRPMCAARLLRGPARASPAARRHRGARVLALLGQLRDHDDISPEPLDQEGLAGGADLNQHRVEQQEFNPHGLRRENHEVTNRATSVNIRLRNLLAPRRPRRLSRRSGRTVTMSIHDAAMRDAEQGTLLVVLVGKEYGTGFCATGGEGDGAAGRAGRGRRVLRAIHRSNLVGMGVLPLQFPDGESAESLGLTGEEEISITGHRTARPRRSGRAGDTSSRRVCASTPRRRSNTTSTAASSRSSCASCPSERSPPPAAPRLPHARSTSASS